ncbi:hypothetical protein [Streptococcus halichoeri]|uniref:hypothetical protein n=1 Tax=Streptococcus halichoeri TaxID=254785 RepID=UPI00135CAC68|nr:hypothetical protein [Streptococcus halichoeri]
MTQKNKLLEADIAHKIKKARQTRPKEDKEKKSLLNFLVLLLVTIAVLISLWVSLGG